MRRATDAALPQAQPLGQQLSANISMLFGELPFIDRFAAAAAAGFGAVEMQYPYDLPAEKLGEAARAAGVSVVLCNAPAGNASAGERGLACLRGREADFRASVSRALDYAGAMDCPRLHVLSGNPDPAEPLEDSLARTADNLFWASETASRAGITVLVEGLNTRDAPGYLVSTPSEALALIARCASLGHAAPLLLFDAYHCAMAGLDPAVQAQATRKFIGHVQIADAPGRNEPGSGAIDWPALLSALDAIGWRGWIGCEYRPLGDTVQGLNWREKLAARLPARESVLVH